jgi:hypothetical protein
VDPPPVKPSDENPALANTLTADLADPKLSSAVLGLLTHGNHEILSMLQVAKLAVLCYIA